MTKIAVLNKWCLYICFFIVSGCGFVAEKEEAGQALQGAGQGYNLNNPEVITLPAQLNEISGISYNEKDNSVFAIHDESGNMYKVPLQKKPEPSTWALVKRGDYEDIFIQDTTVYILESGGSIFYFPLRFPVANMEEATLNLKGKNEFEVLFKDPSANRLLMMCKECKGDSKSDVSVFAFDLNTKTFGPEPAATLKRKDIEKVLEEQIDRFKPSAAALHPQTGALYIISSINKLLVVTDASFAVKEVYKLDPKLFGQPEGLTFTTSGDLLVSNEAGETGNPTILIFRQAK